MGTKWLERLAFLALGIGISAAWVHYEPFTYEDNNITSRVARQKGSLSLTIGYDPDCRYIDNVYSHLGGSDVDNVKNGKWKEEVVANYKHPQRAIEARNRVLKALRD